MSHAGFLYVYQMETLEDVITDYGITTRKLNSLINKRVNSFFYLEKIIFKTNSKKNKIFNLKRQIFIDLHHKRIIKANCREIAKSYVDFIQCYMRYKNKSNFRKISKVLLKGYEAFSAALQSVIIQHKQAEYFWIISDIWFEIIGNLEKKAKKSADFATYNIATQIRTDMEFYLEFYKVKFKK